MTVLSDKASGAPCGRLAWQRWRDLAGDGTTVNWLESAIASLIVNVVPDGVSLGPATIADATVVPVVKFDDDVIGARIRAGLGPALDRATLRDRLEQGGVSAASPVRDAMFVGVWDRTNLTSLSRLGGYGQPVLLVPSYARPDSLALAECDWRSIGVASVTTEGTTNDELHWLVPPVPPRSTGATSMRFERLFGLALTATR